MSAELTALAGCCEEANGWPKPGSGRTLERFDHLTEMARADVVLGRLVEAHADAVAILAEMGGPPVALEQRWGVWAAGPAGSVRAAPSGRGWVLTGTKCWCSGATLLTHALVDATTDEGQRLFAVDLADAGIRPTASTWVGPGMARADTREVEFSSAPAVAVGRPGQYLSRPGFWAGAVGVAACWFGGTLAAADRMVGVVRVDDPLFDVHVGAVHVALTSARAVLADAASRIDSCPGGDHKVTALAARSAIERVAAAVLDRVGRALGPGPLAHDAEHAANVADLTVYIRQHHAERDLADLGRALLSSADRPW